MKTEEEVLPEGTKVLLSLFFSIIVNLYLAFYTFELKRQKLELFEALKESYTRSLLQEEVIKRQEIIIKLYEKKTSLQSESFARN